MKYLMCLLLLLGIATVSLGAENMVSSGILMSHDSDYADTRAISLGYQKLFKNKQYMGISGGDTAYKENGKGTIDFVFMNFSGRKKINDNIYAEGDFRLNQSDDWDTTTYNLSVVGEKVSLGRVELFTERSIIDSHAAIERHLTFTTYGISADYELTDELVLTGVLFHQHATDGNNRLGQVLQLIASPKRFEGWHTRLRGKWRQADFNPPEYFAPEKFSRYDWLIGYATAFANDHWIFRAEGGPGYQYIDDVGETGWEYKISVNGWISESVKLESFYAATTDAGEEDYRYDWGGVSVSYYW